MKAKAKRKKYLRVLYQYALDLNTITYQPNPDYQLIPANKANLKEMRAQQPKEFPKEKYRILRERLDNPNEKCLLIVDHENNICGYCHTAFTDHLNARINYLVKLGPSEIYTFDTRVFKKYRRRGLHVFSILERLHRAKQMGYERALTMVEKDNIPSTKSCLRLNFRVTKTLYNFPFLNITIARNKAV